MDIIKTLAQELEIKPWQAEAAVGLIDGGNTIPFISRYRKEATGSLNDEVLRKFDIATKNASDDERFTHGYYQGLIVEIGNMRNFTTFVPAQDQNRKFLDRPLVEVCSTIQIPKFSYDNLVDRARTVDTIWFNERRMPNSFFEVEHTTDIQNSVLKFCDLQDFNSRFIIVAPRQRQEQFNKVMSRTAFKEIKNRVGFHSYEDIIKQYELMCKARQNTGFI